MTPARLRESFFGEIKGPVELQRRLEGSGAASVVAGSLEVAVGEGESELMGDGSRLAVPGTHLLYHSTGSSEYAHNDLEVNSPLTNVQTPLLQVVGPL